MEIYMTIKHSRQREAIYNYLISTHEHPSAEAVYEFVRNEFPNISLGTVYRNLSFLVDNGQAVKVPCSDGTVHFDGNLMPHYHFQCTKCGRIFDLNFDCTQVERELNSAASKNFKGKILGNVSYFYGICTNCLDNP